MNKQIDWTSTAFICTLPDYERYIIRKRIIATLKVAYGTVNYAQVEEAMCNRVCDLEF